MTSINASPPLALNRRLSFPILALLAALTVGLLFLLPSGFVQAQGAEQSFPYTENGDWPGGDLHGQMTRRASPPSSGRC